MDQHNEESKTNKSRKNKLFVLVIILLLVIFASFKLLSKPNENSKGKEAKVETKKEKKQYDQGTLDLQEALEGIRKMFVDGKPGTTRADITPEELKDVKAKIDKLEDSDVKKELLAEYERIKKGPTESSNNNQNSYDSNENYSE